MELSGRTAPNFLKFVASKILQEQYVWEFIQSKSEVNFDVVTLLPSFLLGVCSYDLRVHSLLIHSQPALYKVLSPFPNSILCSPSLSSDP